MYVLSVRFHLKECTDLNLTKEELYQNINNALKPHNITPYKEGLYHCDESALDYIKQVQHQILNDEKSSKLIKNFDVVHIDLAGNYSYHSYLHQEHIYMK